MSNHYILSFLGSRSAWIYTPSRPDEKKLGYDASLQNFKAALVQYKKVTRINTSDQGVSITIDASQHSRLVTNFTRAHFPYVFYCFSAYHSYSQVGAHFHNPGSPAFFYFSLFFDAHAFPVGVKSVRLFGNGKLKAHLGSGKYSPSIRYYCGPSWVAMIKRCQIGAPIPALSEYVAVEELDGLLSPRLNYIYFPLSEVEAA